MSRGCHSSGLFCHDWNASLDDSFDRQALRAGCFPDTLVSPAGCTKRAILNAARAICAWQLGHAAPQAVLQVFHSE
jgi:hypothetical protein